MTRKERFDDMEKALRANCPCEYVLDEIPFDFYAVNMVYHGWGNIEQALTEFAEKMYKQLYANCHKQEIYVGEIDHYVYVYDYVDKIANELKQEFLNSLKNQTE